MNLPLSIIDRLPIDVPTDFIVGSAGLGSVMAFVLGLATVITGRVGADPLRFAGYGAGLAGTGAAGAWLLSWVGEVLLGRWVS